MKTQQTGNPMLNQAKDRTKWLQYITFALLLFGIKLQVIHEYANATPHWDQWDGEAANLYRPFINGKLGLADLFAPHNEHRIFTTRILALILLKINKLWNPILQMVVNAGLHIFAILLCIHLLLSITGRKYLPLLLAFAFCLFIVPYGWENTLGGFQSQFYFVLIFSITTLWFVLTDAPFSKKWWIGIGCAVLAFFSLASGVFAIAAAAAVSVLFYIIGVNRSWKQLLAIVLLAGLAAVEFKMTPILPDHATMKASSFGVFFEAFTGTLSWPLSPGLAKAILRNLPALLFSVMLIWKRPPASDKRWFLLGMIAWSVGQSMSIAYGRATLSLASRYLDLFALGVVLNLACLVSLLHEYFAKRGGLAYAGMIAWIGIVLISMRLVSKDPLPEVLMAKQSQGETSEMNVRNYLATGDMAHLRNKAKYAIPYPDPERLAQILNWPEIRNILPTNLRPAAPAGRLDGLTKWMLENYILFLFAGGLGVVLTGYFSLVSLQQKRAVPAPAPKAAPVTKKKHNR